jgi:hypothetical protein
MMSRLSNVVKQHPRTTFFVLAYALSWILESPLGTEAPFPQAEKAGGNFGDLTEVFGVRSPTTSAIKEV